VAQNTLGHGAVAKRCEVFKHSGVAAPDGFHQFDDGIVRDNRRRVHGHVEDGIFQGLYFFRGSTGLILAHAHRHGKQLVKNQPVLDVVIFEKIHI